jgi:predicted ATPase/class 3 adenylate cyclase
METRPSHPEPRSADLRALRPEAPSSAPEHTDLVEWQRGPRGVIHRARRASDGARVLLKSLSPGDADPRAMRRLRWEFQVLRELDAPSVARALRWARTARGPAIELEALEGDVLAARRGARLDPPEVVRVGAALARALADLHGRRAVHRDLCAASVAYDPAARRVTLLDLGLASTASAAAAGDDARGGVPGYMAPEQTGHVDRAVDARADLHAAGAVLYELLTGATPVATDDPLAAVHATIARLPTPPSALGVALPAPLERVVLRLLAKAPEDRYQSAERLAADLDALDAGEPGDDIPRVADDVVERWSPPSQLHGRGAERAALARLAERARAGEAVSVAITGAPGVGKTTLVRDFAARFQDAGGVFAGAKFDQFSRATPLGAVTRALGDAVRALLTLADAALDAVRARAREAVGDNGAVVIDVVPEARWLLGDAPAARPLSIVEARNRFQATLEEFVCALHEPARPLALFLDDVQWVDAASLEVIARLVRRRAARPMVLLSWRESEHGAQDVIDRVEALARECDVPAVHLGALGGDAVAALLAEALGAPVERVAPLAGVVADKTGANPFFVRQFLDAARERSLLRWDRGARAWSWRLEDVRAAALSDNVAELVAARISAQGPETADALAVASLLGDRVAAARLACALDLPPEAVRRRMAPAVDAGLAHLVADPDAPGDAYAFAHDRVRRAASEHLAAGARADASLAAARRLLPALAGDADEPFFATLRVVESVLDRLVDPAERRAVARAFRDGGVRARRASAPETAIACFEQAALLLGDAAWSDDHALACAVHLGGAEASVLAPRTAARVDFAQRLLDHARGPDARAAARRARIRRHIVVNENVLALDETLAALAELGVSIPASPSRWHLAAALAEVTFALRGRSEAELSSLPAAADPAAVSAQELLMQAGAAAYYAAPTLLPLLILRCILLALRRGVCGASAMAFAGYTLLLVVLRGEVAGAAPYAAVARAILARLDARDWIARTEATLGFWQTRWRPLAQRAQDYAELYRVAIETGDFEFAALFTFNQFLFGFIAGDGLEELSAQGDRLRELAARLGHRRSELAMLALRQAVACLRGEADDPGVLDGAHWDARERLREVEATGLRSDVMSVHLWGAALRVHQGAHADALAHLDAAERDLRSTLGSPQEFTFHLYAAVARALASPGRPALERRSLLRAARRSADTLRKIARSSPQNFGHHVALADACVAAAEGKGAARPFDEALRLAAGGGFTRDAALAAFLAARHLLAAGESRAAAQFLADARVQHARWGAGGVAPRLEELARDLRAAGVEVDAPAARAGGSNVDAVALARAAAALAGETRLRELLDRLVRVLLEAGGARRALVVRAGEGGALVSAQARVPGEGGEASVTVDEAPLSEVAPELAAAVAYVLRTAEPLVLHDARRDARYSDGRIAPSVLVAPLVRGGRALGAVALTHDLAPGVFDASRAEFVALLAAQAAISIENARLYDELRATLDAQQRLNRSIERFIPHAFLQHLDKGSIIDIEPGDQVSRTITVLFADIRGFSTLAERLLAAGTFRFINEYVRQLEPAIREHRGFINQYLGDGIMALFPSTADDAVAGAVAMHEALRRFNAARDASAGHVRIGVGLNTGDIILGTIGVSERLDCGVVGDAVNLAARIEGMTKTYDAPLLASESTVRGLSHPERFALREVDHVVALGRRQAVRIFEVIDADEGPRRDAKLRTLDAFRAAREAFLRREFRAAREGFDGCVAACPDDRAARLLAERCGELEGKELPDDWGGVWRLQSK